MGVTDAGFNAEKLRGAVTSVLSGGIAGALNLGVTSLGVSAPLSAFLTLYVFGNVIAYTADIMFAKQTFLIGGQHQQLAYTAFLKRFKWFLSSLVSATFYKFFITVIIDTLIGLTLLQSSVTFLNRKGVLEGFSLRDSFVSAFVALLTFFLFTNMLRFDWAYSDKPTPPMMDVVILMWAALVMMLFAMNYRRGPDADVVGEIRKEKKIDARDRDEGEEDS